MWVRRLDQGYIVTSFLHFCFFCLCDKSKPEGRGMVEGGAVCIGELLRAQGEVALQGHWGILTSICLSTWLWSPSALLPAMSPFQVATDSVNFIFIMLHIDRFLSNITCTALTPTLCVHFCHNLLSMPWLPSSSSPSSFHPILQK